MKKQRQANTAKQSQKITRIPCIPRITMVALNKAQKTYVAVLVRLMSFVNDRVYEADHVFSQDELAPLKPDDIKRWMCVQEPDPDENPTLARSSSLKPVDNNVAGALVCGPPKSQDQSNSSFVSYR
jgi:hypothetical protein